MSVSRGTYYKCNTALVINKYIYIYIYIYIYVYICIYIDKYNNDILSFIQFTLLMAKMSIIAFLQYSILKLIVKVTEERTICHSIANVQISTDEI